MTLQSQPVLFSSQTELKSRVLTRTLPPRKWETVGLGATEGWWGCPGPGVGKLGRRFWLGSQLAVDLGQGSPSLCFKCPPARINDCSGQEYSDLGTMLSETQDQLVGMFLYPMQALARARVFWGKGSDEQGGALETRWGSLGQGTSSVCRTYERFRLPSHCAWASGGSPEAVGTWMMWVNPNF